MWARLYLCRDDWARFGRHSVDTSSTPCHATLSRHRTSATPLRWALPAHPRSHALRNQRLTARPYSIAAAMGTAQSTGAARVTADGLAKHARSSTLRRHRSALDTMAATPIQARGARTRSSTQVNSTCSLMNSRNTAASNNGRATHGSCTPYRHRRCSRPSCISTHHSKYSRTSHEWPLLPTAASRSFLPHQME